MIVELLRWMGRIPVSFQHWFSTSREPWIHPEGFKHRWWGPTHRASDSVWEELEVVHF